MKILKGITYTLGFLCVLLAVGISMVMMKSLPGQEEQTFSEPREKDIPEMEPQEAGQPQESFELYHEVFSKRDVFQPVVKFSKNRNSHSTGTGGQVPDGVFQEGRYKVVAIIIDHNPETVIQDTVSRETFFLSVGEDFAGAVVEQIMPGKIVLNTGGRQVVLSP